MTIQEQLKLISYDELLAELHRLKNMYAQFAETTDGLIASSSFHIITKDLETLLNKFDNNKKSPCIKQEATNEIYKPTIF